MAQALREGCAYSLITEEDNNEKRQVYFVKLTDSCLKAIEEHTDEFKSGSKMKSIIRFDDAHGGAVTIPSNPMKGIKKTFVFAISNVLTSDTNPLQCIKQGNWKSDQLLSYGPLEQKISIAATDDCYENTRNRMAQVDQERKDIRTKEIKLGSMKKGRKSLSKMIVTDTHKMSTTKNIKKINPHPSNSSKPVSSLTTTAHAVPAVALPKKSPAKKSPKSSTSTNSQSTAGKEFTCRERVIHILSLRQHKKPELILRLQREGMSQKDRSNLAMVLKQVASHSDNQYTLLPHLFTDLQVDSWPFFNENEKSIVKRNIASNRKSDSMSSQLVSSTSKSPEDKLLSKRSLLTNTDHINKKQKVECLEEPSSTSISPKLTDNDKLSSISNTFQENKTHGGESPQTVASTSDSPEYLSLYKSITTKEQRCQYKRDFQLEYDEYLKLKKYLDEVASKFNELKSSLTRTVEGSAEYIQIKNEIVSTYQRQQQDERYYRTKCRYEELQQKLSHIKKLVMEYDSRMDNS